MSRFVGEVEFFDGGFPRVSGDEPAGALARALPWPFSPRERG